jgi:lipopolysaccharide export system protein LptC
MSLAKPTPVLETAPAGAPGMRPRGGPAHPPRLSRRDRYSFFVVVMKVALPALAAALLLLLVAWPQLDPSNDRLGLDLSDLSIEQPDKLSMLNARFSGFDEKNQPFVVTADVASQSPEDENLVSLELPKADLTLEEGAWIALTASEGLFDRAEETLRLAGQVSFYHDRGIELHSESALIDLKAGQASGEDAVTGHGYFGKIEAEGFEMNDRGARILFTGRSSLLVYPGAGDGLAEGIGQ